MQDSDTRLWRTRSRCGRIAECVARFARDGVEVEILSDGSPIITRFFTTGTEAAAWAEEAWASEGADVMS